MIPIDLGFRRDPFTNPIDLAGQHAAAKEAIACTLIIRNWLPTQGRTPLSSKMTMDNWFATAWGAWRPFVAYHPRRGLYSSSGPYGTHLLWREICDAMMLIGDHYQWHDVDGINTLPNSDVRGGSEIPPIDPLILDRICLAADWLLAMHEPTEDELLRQACDNWNNGSTWPQITLALDGQIYSADADDRQKQIDACSAKVKRFADKHGIPLERKKAGRKSQ